MKIKTSKDLIGVTGHVVARAYRDGKLLWEEKGSNLVVDEGLSYILQAAITKEASPVAGVYVGLLDNYTPLAGSTMAQVGLAANEFENYTPATRPAYAGVETGKTSSNTASPAVFTIGAAADKTVYGAFLCSSAVKNEVASTLIAAKLFSAPRVLLENDVLNITYEVTAAAA